MTTRVLWHPAHLHRGTLRAPAALDRASAVVKGAFSAFRTWRQRNRERAELGALSDRMLSDIGITRADAVFLSNKPFWKE
jgi:uncharacterized protein YjiS (DUF1127 family)